MSAHRQTDQIVGVRHRMSFVEVVDAPDQTAFEVAPRTKILHMKIADRQHLWPLRKIRTDLGPDLCPAVKRGAQEGENSRLHVGVFENQILGNKIRAMA